MDIIEDEQLNSGEELCSDEAQYLLNSIDPFETDQIILSEVVKLLTAHPAKNNTQGSESGVEQISVLEKFVTKAIEQEESQKRIMIKLQEKIIEENKNEENQDNSSINESEKLLTEKDQYSKESLQISEGVKPFENMESQTFDELRQEYEKYDNYHANRGEGENKELGGGEDNKKEVNYLVKELDPVEEDKEEHSQKSMKDSVKKRGSVNNSDENLNEGNILIYKLIESSDPKEVMDEKEKTGEEEREETYQEEDEETHQEKNEEIYQEKDEEIHQKEDEEIHQDEDEEIYQEEGKEINQEEGEQSQQE